MEQRRYKKMTTAFAGVIFLFACDRILKYWALAGLYHTKIDIINNWLSFELFKNEAIAFSIPLPQLVIIPLTIIIIAALVIFLAQRLRCYWGLVEIGCLFIIGGALSNLYDRLQYGFVVDYLNFIWWPVFNLADVMISAGVALILWKIVRR
jgi:signal peptidase II